MAPLPTDDCAWPGVRASRVSTNGIHLYCAEAGPADGPLVLLLHGFPESAYGWRHQIPALAAAGYRVVAPDLRGYGRSSKPGAVRDYRTEALVGDVVGLIDRLGGGRAAILVGHDWGGIIAWHAAMWHPDRVARLAVLNAPHPAAYLRELRRGWPQRLRSWYVLFFQLPWFPEAVLGWNGYAVLRATLRDGPARHGARPDEDVRRYLAALAPPGAIAAALNYYRAAFRLGPTAVGRGVRPVDVPTLHLWGDRDRYLVPSLADGLEPWVSGIRVEHLPTGTHWVQHDEVDLVNDRLLAFLHDGHD